MLPREADYDKEPPRIESAQRSYYRRIHRGQRECILSARAGGQDEGNRETSIVGHSANYRQHKEEFGQPGFPDDNLAQGGLQGAVGTSSFAAQQCQRLRKFHLRSAEEAGTLHR